MPRHLWLAAALMELWHDGGPNSSRSELPRLISSVYVRHASSMAAGQTERDRRRIETHIHEDTFHQPTGQSTKLLARWAALGSSPCVPVSSLGRFRRRSRGRNGWNTRRPGVRSGGFRAAIDNRYWFFYGKPSEKVRRKTLKFLISVLNKSLLLLDPTND